MIIGFDELPLWRESLPPRKKLVVTNGCFDLLHYGHIKYLEEAKSHGDILLVGINSDASVKRLKGENRPVSPEWCRSYILNSLRSVDAVCVFDSDKANLFLEKAKPHAYVKGGDYSLDTLDKEEKQVLLDNQAQIIIAQFEKGFSTTSILDKIIKL